jgi:glucosylceramidase
VDWNIVLDMKGGPNWAKNVVDAPILVDPGSGRYFIQPMFWYLMHFSALVRPGARRVGVQVHKGDPFADLEATAFRDDAQNHIVAVVMNRGLFPVAFALEVAGRGKVRVELPARAIQTLVLKAQPKLQTALA